MNEQQGPQNPEVNSEAPPAPVAGDPTFQDREVACRECGAAFTFTAGEQAFFQSRGFANDPARCPECRTARRGARRSPGDSEPSRIVCAACGLITTVPFRPTAGKPVYCANCYPVRS